MLPFQFSNFRHDGVDIFNYVESFDFPLFLFIILLFPLKEWNDGSNLMEVMEEFNDQQAKYSHTTQAK